jgi:hypothetical protein
VIGVQDEQHVERPLEHRVRAVLELGHLEEHVQEVAREAEVVVRVDVRAADAVTVRVGGDARDLRDQPQDLQPARVLVKHLLRAGVDRREQAAGREKDAHGMGVVLEPLHELLDVLVQHRVDRDVMHPCVERGGRRQFAEEDQIRGLEIRALLGQLLDWIPAIEQHTLVAVDVGDAASARRRVLKRRVVRHQAHIVAAGLDLAEIHRANRALLDGNLVLLAGPVVGNRQSVGHKLHLRHL